MFSFENSKTRKRISTRQQNALARRHTQSSSLRLEALEDRTVPTTLTVGAGKEFSTITAALAAASSNYTIDVYNGTYSAFSVGSNLSGLKLNAEGSDVVIQPTTLTPLMLSGVNVGGAAIDIYARNVTVNGFIVDGSQDTDGNLWAGIRVIQNGLATIENNTVENMLFGAANTNVGVQVGTALVTGTPSDGSAIISNNTIESYQGAGVLVDGSGSNATVEGNTITGQGTANGGIPEYGVQTSNAGAIVLENNTITGNTISGSSGAPSNPPVTSAGVFIYNDDNAKTTIKGNTLSGNDDGILVQQTTGTNVQIQNNVVQDNYGYAGIFVLSSEHVLIAGNEVSNNTTFNGIALNYSSNDNLNNNEVTGNGVSGSETDGIYDLSGSSNIIQNNSSSGNSGNGINLQNSSSDRLSQNIIQTNTLNGIQDLDGTSNDLVSNTVGPNGQNGVYLNGTSGDVVNGNILQTNSGYGIQLLFATNTKITNNTATGNSLGSIYLDSTSTGTQESGNNF